MRRCRPMLWLTLLSLPLCLSLPALAGPTVIPTAEGQLGNAPDPNDRVIGRRFESIRGNTGEVIFGGVTLFGGAVPPPPEMQFLTDMIHGYPDPVPINTTPVTFNEVFETPPGSSRSRNASNTGDIAAFSFSTDGTSPQTMAVRIATYDETGSPLINVPVADNIDTFPDPFFSKTGVAVDNQGRATVVYTELPGGISRISAQRIDGLTGLPINSDVVVNDGGNHVSVDVALLDPAGNRLIIPTVELAGQGISPVKANIVDFSGGTPVVMPEFTVNTTSAQFANGSPVVAANPITGNFLVAWENISALQGDPINVRARRFDANGNPIGNDFRVNTTVAETQAQPSAAMDSNGLAAIAWVGDSSVPGDELDVFMQVYDANGQPIGSEVRVNSQTDGVQDQPTVRFLPEPDALGQTQVAVAWRDVDQGDGSMARGTGTSYKCFSIGFGDPTAIFADGFESGDTSSWSDTQP